jgi:hypothetical protein
MQRNVLHSVAESGGGPSAHLLYERYRRVAVERLGVEEILVAEWDRVLGEGNCLPDVEGEVSEPRPANETRWRRSCVYSKSSPRLATTAFSHFSTACCAWKPTASSSISGSAASLRITFASPSALRARTAATSAGSRSGEDTAFSQRLMDHAPVHVAPPPNVIGTDNNEIDRHPDIPQSFPKSHKRVSTTLQLGLDYEQVEVAARPGVAASVGTKQNHTSIVLSGLCQPSPCLLNRGLIGHLQTKGSAPSGRCRQTPFMSPNMSPTRQFWPRPDRTNWTGSSWIGPDRAQISRA